MGQQAGSEGQEMTLYRGEFNWFGEVLVLHTRAPNRARAFLNFCVQVGKRVGYSLYRTKNHFQNTTRYEIKEVINEQIPGIQIRPQGRAAKDPA